MKNHHYLIYSVVVFFLTGMISIFSGNITESFSAQKQIQEDLSGENIQNNEYTLVHLYFSNRNNSFLKATEKRIFFLNDPLKSGRRIIELLISGPEGELMRTIPEKTRLRALYILKNGTAYVDMSREIKDNHPGGIESEIMTIYSIVNSLVLNIPEIDLVKILIDGKESATLAGHISLKFPFKADMLLIR